MTEQTKAILATVTIVAGLALIGYLAFLRIDGAGMAAVGIVVALVSWFTRTPDRKDPPGGAATVVPLVVGGVLMAAIVACGCAATPPEPPITVTVAEKEKLAEAGYEAQLLRCVADYPPRDPRVDVCADGVRAKWARGKDGGAK